jgi:5-methylcytosine-specific restriction endonuclease McrA
MDDHHDQVQRIQLLLSALFLSDRVPTGGLVERAPGEWVSEWLGLEPHRHFGHAALRHLVAVQLAPQAAISYDRTNPRPRWRLIDDFLQERAPLAAVDRERIARVVAGVLDRASAERGRPLMAVEHTTSCAICRLPFHTEPMSVTTRDPLKPVWQAQEELCRPEVDHVIAISGLGAHRLDNLQVVCRACNSRRAAISSSIRKRRSGTPESRPAKYRASICCVCSSG